MIHFIVHEKSSLPFYMFISSWGLKYLKNFHVLTYNRLFKRSNHPCGVYVFTGIQLLDDKEKELAVETCNILSDKNKYSIINHPNYALKRYELLKLLYENNINKYNVYRLNEDISDLRFPCFLRYENDHKGARTEIIFSKKDLHDSIDKLKKEKPEEKLMIVEFCDTKYADGYYRKYSCVCLDNQILPRHVLFGEYWMLKNAKITSNDLVAEELKFITENPHQETLKKIFKIAGIGFGRIDYSLKNGEIQVWEINTSPVLLRSDHKIDYKRFHVHMRFFDNYIRSLSKLWSSHEKSRGNIRTSERLIYFKNIATTYYRFSMKKKLKRLRNKLRECIDCTAPSLSS